MSAKVFVLPLQSFNANAPSAPPDLDLTNTPFSYSYSCTDLDEYTIIDVDTGSSLSRSLPARPRSLYRHTILNSTYRLSIGSYARTDIQNGRIGSQAEAIPQGYCETLSRST
jgi:hypothetical protein